MVPIIYVPLRLAHSGDESPLALDPTRIAEATVLEKPSFLVKVHTCCVLRSGVNFSVSSARSAF